MALVGGERRYSPHFPKVLGLDWRLDRAVAIEHCAQRQPLKRSQALKLFH